MRRRELVEAIDRILKVLDDTKVIEALSRLVEREGPKVKRNEDGMFTESLDDMMSLFQKYTKCASQFGEIEEKLTKIVRLSGLGSPQFWSLFLQSPRDMAHFIGDMTRGYGDLQSLREMVGFEDTEAPTTSAQGISDEMAGFSIIVVEEKGQLSRATRLASVLQGASSLYDAHAYLLSLPTDALLVKACDTGSDKAFDFLGIAKAIEAVKETIVSLWDRVVFYRERKMHVNIRLVAESLPVLAQISVLAEQNAIAPEQAELLRRQVLEGATQLVEAGAILPETTRGGKAEIRSLVAPETRLLVAPDERSSKSHTKRQGSERRRRKGQRK